MSLARLLLGPFFVLAGLLHFTHRRYYEAIVPPYVPRHREVVYLSGAAEIAGGVASMVPSLRRGARWWLLALLAAVYPANIHMALNPDQIKGLRVPRWTLWARLPIQGLFALWVWRGTK